MNKLLIAISVLSALTLAFCQPTHAADAADAAVVYGRAVEAAATTSSTQTYIEPRAHVHVREPYTPYEIVTGEPLFGRDSRAERYLGPQDNND